MMCRLRLALFLLFCLTGSIYPVSVYAQPDYTLPLDKPAKYKNRTLRSEKSEDLKFTLPRKVYQGMVTHYNYYYHANLKIENIVAKAKIAHKDDFGELLPFYNYSTELTRADSTELDSILYKASAGIVLHDLRNSYIDNLYMLAGRAYFHWGKLDSAYRIFQFTNYRFFPKSKDEYNIVVGSNSRATKGELNISTKEKKGIIRKLFSRPPSRNESLLWIAKTYAADSLFPEAVSLCHLLKRDKFFPRRLQGSVDEVLAYVNYRQENWDSTAYYLKRSLKNCTNKTDLSRWEYLLAQLYVKLQKNNEAAAYYVKAQKHTPDPVLYIYARIYGAQIVKNSKGNDMESTYNELIKLSRRERFDGFEDILFYAAADIALERRDTAKAITLLRKSSKYSTENPELKNKIFLKLANLYYQQKSYYLSSAAYDSLNTQDPKLAGKTADIEARKKILKDLVAQIDIVNREDSLQRIAALNEKDRYTLLKKMLRAIRKEKGLKDTDGNPPVYAALGNNTAPDPNIFVQTSGATGSWYFNNNSQKAKGFSEFKARWGQRPNVDNWRRQADIDAASLQQNIMPGNPGGIEGDVDQVGVSDFGNRPQLQDEQDITLQTLESNLPLTDEALKASDEKIENALFNQAMIYKNQLEDYAQASEVLEEILRRFPQTTKEDSILSALIYTQKKAGNKNRSAQYAEMQIAKYPDSKTRLSDLQKEKADPAQQNAPYENILELFKAGQYEAAMFAKKMADSTYGNQYWTPQLLYLEALGYLHKKEDSLALVNASYIESNYAGTEMAVKASTLKDVIQRKNEIIGYLQGTDIQKEEEKILEIPYEERPTLQHAAQAVIPRNRLPVITAYPFMKFALKRPVSGIEAVVHNLQRKELLPYNSSMRLTTPVLQPLMPLKTEKIDMIYVYNTSEPYQLLMVFEPMDQVYRNEAKIAIQRHHNTTRGGQDLTVKLYEPEKENAWMEIGSFASLGSAMGYYDETAPNMSKIIPWLNPGKYQWLIISDSNLEILKNRKDISEYLLFIRQYVKGKF